MAMQSSSSSSSSSFAYGFSFDVFISFRGTDTRFGFTGNLYKALSDKGIRTFIDDKELQIGDEITPSLLKSIEDSRIAIIVFSKDYASSSFCLDELVHIIRCSNEKGSTVIPVFYDTEPSHVRKQNDSYGEALSKHEKRFQNNDQEMKRLEKWKIALNQAANLAGHHFNLGNEYERDFIEKIVTDVSNKINHAPLHVADYLVGLKSRISEVNSLLELGSDDGVQIIGILGTGGMGKTTLAQVVYNLIANQFECKCFLHNVRENSVKHGLVYLQEQLLSKSIAFQTQFGHVNEGIPIIKRRLCQKKVLLILDDVDNLKQLEILVGEPGWLGHGSRVIIITRDKHLLSCHGIKKIYEADGLNKEQALELLRMMAFKSNKYDSRYDYILNRAVKYASGLPLALEVVGSNLFGKSIAECESLLDKYDRIPHEDIQKILKVSYDPLDEEQQSVFLDIACVFKGCRKEYVQEALHDHYGYCIKSHIGVLVDKSLIKISFYGGVTLHDLIEDMGIEIVRQESRNEPGERSRLWCHDDIVHVLQKNTGTSKIQMIYLNFPSEEPVIEWNGEAFKKMTNLKTLVIKIGQFSKSPMYIPSTLRVLVWERYSLKSLSSSILSKKFNYMKVLTLKNCQYLTDISNVSNLPNLEEFSIGQLSKLKILNAKNCNSLESFPPLWLPSLNKFKLAYCRSLISFPELLCKMTYIKDIWLCGTSIADLPISFQNLSESRSLSLLGCGLPHKSKTSSIVISNVDHVLLNKSNLSDERLPILLKWCANVKLLYLSGNNFKILPECLSVCHLLRNLNLDECKALEEIRGIPPNLNYLSAMECDSLSSSSRRRLLSQKLHEAGCTDIRFPTRTEEIPDWFEHQSRGHGTISFWFRKKIPSITSILLCPGTGQISEVDLFVNGHEYYDSNYLWCGTNFMASPDSEHAFLFDLKLEEHIDLVDIAEWTHVELKLTIYSDTEENEKINILRSAPMGIHVLKEKSNTEEDVIFTNPYSRKRKLDEYLNASLSQFEPPLKKQRLVGVGVGVGVSEIEILQQQHLAALLSGMRNLVLTETKDK